MQLSIDVMNIGNLLNDKWGVTQTPSACNDGRILTYVGKNANGNPLYNLATNSKGLITEAFEPKKSTSNCWYLQFGVKLIFE